MPGRDVDTALRVTHDLTQSIWLGGALMGAVSLDAAASVGPDQRERIRGVDRAWSRWQRISTPAIVAHLVSGTGLTLANRGRLTVQAGAGRTVAVRIALTGVALATEVTARRLGRRLGEHQARTSTDGEDTRPTDGSGDATDPTTAALQRDVAVAQWANVAAIATMVAVGARMGEQQRPRELLRGIASRLGLAA